MEFVFEKLGAGTYDRLRVDRNGRVEEVLCPKTGGIPHDMIHFAVENTLTKRGYMRRVASGEPLSLRMRPDIESDQMERLVEVMQADALSRYPAAADMLTMYAVTCEARGVEPYPVSADDVAHLRTEIARLEILWAQTKPGTSLNLTFDAELAH